MMVSEQMTSAAEFMELWQALMPGTTAPGKDQFLVWTGIYTSEQVSRGINGAARKLRAMHNVSRSMTNDDVARYASSIMKHEALGQRRFEK